jgi:hypothetical protein
VNFTRRTALKHAGIFALAARLWEIFPGHVSFAESDPQHQTALFDNFCDVKDAQPFARRLIELICAGYYTTRAGHAAIGYVGNVALERFPPPSPEIIKHFEEVLSALPTPSPIAHRRT